MLLIKTENFDINNPKRLKDFETYLIIKPPLVAELVRASRCGTPHPGSNHVDCGLELNPNSFCGGQEEEAF